MMPPPPISTPLSLHDALPISLVDILKERGLLSESDAVQPLIGKKSSDRSEERFSRNAETNLVCRLLLEKKKDEARAWQSDKRRGTARRMIATLQQLPDAVHVG